MSKGYNAFRGDFLNYKTDKKYDRIIAAPPFKGNADLLHIQHMYDMLAPDGVIVSLTSPFWLTNNEPHQVDFRSFLEDKTHSMTVLPDNSFMERGKTVPTGILRISRK